MRTTKKWWVYVETGEAVFTRTVEGAIELLQPRYRGHKLTPENVVPEEEVPPVESKPTHNGRFWA
jgi:hypothetical protein